LGKAVDEEIAEAKRLVLDLMKRAAAGAQADQHRDPWFREYELGLHPSIGLLSFTRDPVNELQDWLTNEVDDTLVARHDLMVGTTEDWQGNERDIMLLLLGHDGDASSRVWNGYNNANRFNVATSRARRFTYLLYGGLHPNMKLVRRLLSHHGQLPPDEETASAPPPPESDWTFDWDACESEFERRVAEWLENDYLAADHRRKARIQLYNQITACDQFRLDFVLFNPNTQEAVALEVDGKHHFKVNSKQQTQDHHERVEVLRRAGWRLVHTAYWNWYQYAWLCQEQDPRWQAEVARLAQELDQHLLPTT